MYLLFPIKTSVGNNERLIQHQDHTSKQDIKYLGSFTVKLSLKTVIIIIIINSDFLILDHPILYLFV